MKRRMNQRVFSALLCLGMLLQLLPTLAAAVTVTAVNETVLPATDATMPVRLGGEMYAPYSVFTDVTDTAAYAEDTVTMVSGDKVLVFSTTQGTVYDQDFVTYDTPAYNRSGTVYVPVELVCGQLGLGYSTLPVSDDSVLRITNSEASTDDATFLQTHSTQIQGAIRAYNGDPEGVVRENPPEPQKPVVANVIPVEDPRDAKPPAVEEAPKQRSSRVYLCYYGPTTENTAEVLDALKTAGQKATFFLPTDISGYDDDLLRRIVGEGHSVGLLLYETSAANVDALVTKLTDANAYLAFVTGAQTRILSNATGCQNLSVEQRNALVLAGYRFWDSTFDSEDISKKQEDSYKDMVQHLISTNAPISIRLRHGKQTAKITEWMSAYLARQGIDASAITVTMTPMNYVGEVR